MEPLQESILNQLSAPISTKASMEARNKFNNVKVPKNSRMNAREQKVIHLKDNGSPSPVVSNKSMVGAKKSAKIRKIREKDLYIS